LIFLGIFFGYLHAPATAKAVDTGMIVCNNGNYIAIIYVDSSGSLQIDSATIYGTNVKALNNASLTQGENTVELLFPSSPEFLLQEGETYQILLGLSNGMAITANVVFLGNVQLPSTITLATTTSTTTTISSTQTTTKTSTTSTTQTTKSTTQSKTTTSTSNINTNSVTQTSSSTSSQSSTTSSSSSSKPPIIEVKNLSEVLVDLIPISLILLLGIYYSRNLFDK
jgi:hypothetical protein